jgi:hypothetical protein
MEENKNLYINTIFAMFLENFIKKIDLKKFIQFDIIL